MTASCNLRSFLRFLKENDIQLTDLVGPPTFVIDPSWLEDSTELTLGLISAVAEKPPLAEGGE